MPADKIRNIGISAHIDAGKTTLTERILFYTKRIRTVHEVRGSDGVGATMDSMELERERGITISSAATHCLWRDHHINIIDTPGHVDFTIEVERALRVLDGALLVLCAVAGVQSQSYTVDQQMRRHGIPRLAFINKCDRVGADPERVCQQLRERLGVEPVMLQLPIGIEGNFQGVIDLVSQQALYFRGTTGELVDSGPIPQELAGPAAAARERLVEAACMFSDELTEAVLEDRASEELIRRALRRATIKRQLVPVLLGSAYRNKGVQPLLDAVVDYLPAPDEVTVQAEQLTAAGSPGEPLELTCSEQQPLVALAFKLEEGRYGQLTYLRLYQGRLERTSKLYNCRTGQSQRAGRLVRMHADKMEEIAAAGAGDIVAVFGVDCRSQDTFTDGSLRLNLAGMHVPEPVISLGVSAGDRERQEVLNRALARFAKEDPTFRVKQDDESGQTLISGMGELHLEVYLERLRREYGVEVTASPPRVAYRETITRSVEFDYTHRKQTGGAGQFGRIIGWIEPNPEADFEFVDEVSGGAIPRQFMPAVAKGFASMMSRGPLIGAPLVQVRVVVVDGRTHPVDSKEMAFIEAARGAWRESVAQARPCILEPIMRVEVDTPVQFAGPVMASLSKRRGSIIGQQELAGQCRVEAEVPLAEMFGYATVLRSLSQGQANFSMEFCRYLPVPSQVAEQLIAAARAKTTGLQSAGA